MKKLTVSGGVIVAVLFVLALTFADRLLKKDEAPAVALSPPITSPVGAAVAAVAPPPSGAADSQGFLYARVTTMDGATYEGRLRFSQGTEEAFWSDHFNGVKTENTWAALISPDKLPRESHPFKIFGIKIHDHVRRKDLGRLCVARFGDLARLEAHGKQVHVILKNGTDFEVNRMDASDFDDGVRIWDAKRGMVDLDSLPLRTIEFLPTPALETIPSRLHGTVRTKQGEFSGFVEWNRSLCTGEDELEGRTAEGKRTLRFDTIRSIARQSPDSSLVTLSDGSEVALGGTNDVGQGNRGLYVDDVRFGRVRVSWNAFERVDFTPAGSGPAYGDYPPGYHLSGTVTTRSGERLAGRLVNDLDESESVENFDSSLQGVDYSIPFGMVASVVPAGREGDAEHGTVTLFNGEVLHLEHDGDLGEQHAGMLIFVEGREHPDYVPWDDVAKVEFNPPPAVH